MNDAGFWVFSKIGGVTEVETLKSWTPLSAIVGMTSMIVTVVLALAFPLSDDEPSDEVHDSLPPIESVLGSADEHRRQSHLRRRARADGFALTPEMLRESPSGDLFGLTQNVGHGVDVRSRLGGDQFVIVSTLGGLRDADGTPIALGYHTGHWEIGLLVREAAETLRAEGAIPFAAYCSDPCDGRTQGTTGMFDSLAVSQRRRDRDASTDSLAADGVGRARHRDLRQGTSRDDDGARRREDSCRASSCRAA